jgi:formate hydrogenlyase subunit 3/multisubunit Na+/H+ antiporter MnhD subunit
MWGAATGHPALRVSAMARSCVWNHAAMKGLFLGAGSVCTPATRRIWVLGGLARRMPRPPLILLGAIAIRVYRL